MGSGQPSLLGPTLNVSHEGLGKGHRGRSACPTRSFLGALSPSAWLGVGDREAFGLCKLTERMLGEGYPPALTLDFGLNGQSKRVKLFPSGSRHDREMSTMEVREPWGEGQGQAGGRGQGAARGREEAQAARSKHPAGLTAPGMGHSKVFWRLPGPVQATHQNMLAVSQAARNTSLKTRVSLPGSTDRQVWPVRRSTALCLAVTGWTLCGAAVTAGRSGLPGRHWSLPWSEATTYSRFWGSREVGPER